MDDEEYTDVSLRPFTVSDIDDFMLWATDENVTRFCPWEPYDNKEEGINFIENAVIPHPWFKAICLNNRSIGAISVDEYSGDDRCRGTLGYVLATQYWGKGIATRAVKLVVDTIFDEWPYLERLEAIVAVENFASQKVLQKVGFKKEGVLRKYLILKGKTTDVVMYSLISSDPRV